MARPQRKRSAQLTIEQCRSQLLDLVPEALETIVDILGDPHASPRDRLAAAKLTIEYSLPKPVAPPTTTSAENALAQLAEALQ